MPLSPASGIRDNGVSPSSPATCRCVCREAVKTCTQRTYAMNRFKNVKYQPLRERAGQSEPTEDSADLRFTVKPKQHVPWKAIGFAVVLFLGGTLLLILGSLLVAGKFDERFADRTWPLILVGCLMFIPGAYHVRIAYLAFRGYRGYSFDDIPSYYDD